MTWVVLSVATAIFYAVQGAWTKRLTRDVSAMVATWAIFAFSFPVLVLYLAFQGLPAVSGRFWPALLANGALYLLSFYLYVSAIQRGELGLTYPLLALTPIFMVPVEWFLLGDRVGARGLAGIGLVVVGVYLLNFAGLRAPLLEPFRALLRDPGARRMLGVTLLWSVSGTVDRVAVLEASPAVYGASISALMGLAFLPLALRRAGRGEDLREAIPRRTGGLGLQGLLFAALFICQMEALRLSLAAYVIAIKRSGTLLTVLFGTVFFGERRLGVRLGGTLIILTGVFLVGGA